MKIADRDRQHPQAAVGPVLAVHLKTRPQCRQPLIHQDQRAGAGLQVGHRAVPVVPPIFQLEKRLVRGAQGLGRGKLVVDHRLNRQQLCAHVQKLIRFDGLGVSIHAVFE